METGRSTWLLEAGAVLLKDLRCEIRTRHTLNSVLLFSVACVVLVSFVLGGFAPGEDLSSAVYACLLWIIILFSSSTGMTRSFLREEDGGTAVLLRLSSRPSAVFMGKTAFNALLLLGINGLSVPFFVFMVGLRVHSPFWFVLNIFMGVVGLAGASTLVAAMICKAQARGTLFAALSFPVLIPLVMAAVKGCERSINPAAVGWEEPLQLLLFLFAFTGAMVTASVMLFSFVWSE